MSTASGSSSIATCGSTTLTSLLTDQYIEQCSTDSGYAFTAASIPTQDVIDLMCASSACRGLLADAQTMDLTECILPVGDNIRLLADLIDYVPAHCASASGSAAAGSTATATTGSTATATTVTAGSTAGNTTASSSDTVTAPSSSATSTVSSGESSSATATSASAAASASAASASSGSSAASPVGRAVSVLSIAALAVVASFM